RFAAAHNNLALLLERQGKTDEAMKHYRAAVAAQPSHVVSNFNLGILLFSQGKNEDALKHLERVRRLRPDIREASEAIETIRRGTSTAPPPATAP
ncbi:MAG: tetratricopeptide repeat protein, partial [Candidatus Binatia bacterium]